MSETIKQKELLEAEISEIESSMESLNIQLEVKRVRLERKQQALKLIINYLNQDDD